MYSVENQNWINVDFKDLTFVGATVNSNGIGGFVPPPEKGQTDLFLRSDGKWISIENGGEQNQNSVDTISIDIYNNKMSLKNYGLKYYKYDVEQDNYVLQLVDQDNPWKENLIPKVVKENGQLVLGWFEDRDIKNLENNLNYLLTVVGNPKTENDESSGIFFELDKKANKTDIFTKQETENKINEIVAASQHLKRVIISSVEDIDLTKKDAEQYIYLIPSGLEKEENKYYEYLVVKNSSGEKVIEKVGSWETNLSNYFTKTETLNALNEKVDKIEGSRLITNEEGTKLNLLLDIQSIDGTLSFKNNQLSIGQIPTNKINNLDSLISTVSEVVEKLNNISEGAEKNYINSTSEQFTVENGELSLKEISISSIADLDTILASKANNSRVESLEKDVEDIKLALTWTSI